MAITPHDVPHRDPAPLGRPVLGGVRAGLAAVRGSAPERIWALTDDEVAESLRVLADLVTASSAVLVAVLTEARQRSLGAGDGWGPSTGRGRRRRCCRRACSSTPRQWLRS